MPKLIALCLLAMGCSHDLDSLRGTGPGSDSGAEADGGRGADSGSAPDSGPVDSGGVDAPSGCALQTLFESATVGMPPTDGLLLGDGVMRYWRFQVLAGVEVSTVGVNAKLDAATGPVSLRIGVFMLSGSTDVPDGVDFASSDLVIDTAAEVETTAPADVEGVAEPTPLAVGWYAIGVIKSGPDPVRVTHGHTDLGSIRPATLVGATMSTQGSNSRLFVRGCRP